jgi:hypothetical protein
MQQGGGGGRQEGIEGRAMSMKWCTREWRAEVELASDRVRLGRSITGGCGGGGVVEGVKGGLDDLIKEK